MVNFTRLDCAVGSSALMRAALAQAIHHASHRRAFGDLLIDQPLMQNVLAELALESEAATALCLRVARAVDEAVHDRQAAALKRIGTALAKYYVCKRAPLVVGEALECLGGNGYVEESIMPRLYREAPLNSIWEGSGNINALDVLRILRKQPESFAAWRDEIAQARGEPAIEREALRLERDLHDAVPAQARSLAERMAVLWQASLLVAHAPQSRRRRLHRRPARRTAGPRAWDAAPRLRAPGTRRACVAARRPRGAMTFAKSDERTQALVRRRWTQRERGIVWRGLTGRFALAIEPLIGMVFMAMLTWGILYRAQHVPSDATLGKIAWIFGLGAIAFAGYFVAVLVAPIVAYAQTFAPIYILDGYVRYRGPDERSQPDACGYAAALFPDRIGRRRMGVARAPAPTRRDDPRAPRVLRLRRHSQDRRQVDRPLAGRRAAAARDRHRDAPRQAQGPLEGRDSVRRSPAGRAGVGSELLGAGGAEVRGLAGAVAAARDAVQRARPPRLAHGPERLAAVLLLEIPGEREGAGKQRRRNARSVGFDPAAIVRRVVLRNAAARHRRDVVRGRGSLHPGSCCHDGFASLEQPPPVSRHTVS